MSIVQILTIIVLILFVAVSVVQVLLALGYPLGEFAMGGYYKVLPRKLRFVSVINALIVLFMGFIFLLYSKILSGFDYLPTTILVWIITVFLGLNTIANVISRSKKERLVMTPLSGLAFILCLIIILS